MKKILAFLLLAFCGTANAIQAPAWHSQTFLASGTWIAPPGVSQAWITGCGGGAGGGAGGATYMGGGGGAGEFYYNMAVSVTPGTSYDVIIGSAGTGGSGTNGGGKGGGDTTFAGTAVHGAPGFATGYSAGAGGGPFGVKAAGLGNVATDVGFTSATFMTLADYYMQWPALKTYVIGGANGGGGGGNSTETGQRGGKFNFGGMQPSLANVGGTSAGLNRAGGGAAGAYGPGGNGPATNTVDGNSASANSCAGGSGCGNGASGYVGGNGGSGQLTIQWVGL